MKDQSTAKTQTFKKRISKRIKTMDIYAKPIELTHKGEDRFKSTMGGSVSLLVLLFMVAISLYKFDVLMTRGHTTVKKNTIINISNSYMPPDNISAKNVSIAFNIFDFWSVSS